MEPLPEPADTVWSFPFPPQDWVQTPLAVQAVAAWALFPAEQHAKAHYTSAVLV